MPGVSIATLDISEELLWQEYGMATKFYAGMDWTDLDRIFAVAVKNRSLFPGITLTHGLDVRQYIRQWVKGYCDAVRNPPSGRRASPKSVCTDPAIRIIVQAAQNMSPEEAGRCEQIHNLFMSAENVQGNLLEEYIAANVRPYGFLWCEGNVLRAVDFCNTDGSCLLQIKNKSNTENSSSSNIRQGTSIQKWFRLATSTRGGVKTPVYRWDILNRLISEHRTQGGTLPTCQMSEEDYQRFLQSAAGKNRAMITGL